MEFDTGRRGARSVVVVCLAALYFLLAMGAALLGSSVYRSVAADGAENSTHRIALSYVVNQVRRGDAGGVEVGKFGGADAVRLTETLDDGSVYITLLYCCDGALRELYMEEGTGLAPEDGVAILSLDGLELTVTGGTLGITASAGGASWSVELAPRSGIREVGAL